MHDLDDSTTSAWRERAHRTLASARAAAWAHAVALGVGLLVLAYLGRDQWFFFDEWDFIWQPEGMRRLVEGHNGHWSSVPIAIWMAIQNTLGLQSYFPFLLVAICAHLVLAHLLWRLLRRVGCHPWLTTALTTVFILFGSATENLMWAFQYGYMGAIAFEIGALLLVSRHGLGPVGVVSASALVAFGAATAGTALPFFIPVALTALVVLGWRRALAVVVPPTLIYAFWYVFLAGVNPTTIYRATGVGESLEGIPRFMATMYVDGLGTITPVPAFGIVLITAVAVWTILRVRDRLTPADVIILSMIAAGIVFAGLTAYSRLGMGVGASTAPRYVYLVVVSLLPAIGVILTRLVSTSAKRLTAVSALLAAVFVFNVGSLLVDSSEESVREQNTHALVSAALDLADEYPDDVDLDAQPDPDLVPRTLAQLQDLEADFGMTRVSPTASQTLTALVNVGIRPVSTDIDGSDCESVLVAGDRLTASGRGSVLRADEETRLTVAAVDGRTMSADAVITLKAGTTRLVAPYEVGLIVRSSDMPVSFCAESEQP